MLILVSGALANKPGSGGEAWVRLSWVRGLRRLGCEVCFVETIDGEACVDGEGRPAPFEESFNRRYFEASIAALGGDSPAALLCDGGRAGAGLSHDEVLDRAREADLLVNISGHLDLEPLKSLPRRRAYVDVDPAFTQYWERSKPGSARLGGHDAYFTVGVNIGRADCGIPTLGLDWLPLPPPVTLDDWPAAPVPADGRFTTISTWRSPLGTLSSGETTFPGKHHEWRRVRGLPRRSRERFEIALDIHPGDARDADELRRHGWTLVDPRAVAGDGLRFRSYVQQSAAEFSVAHGAYVTTNSGWISDRTVRYLASGRPAVVQDTGIADRYPVGEGLLVFRTVEEAAAAAEAAAREPAAHAQAARALAEQHFDADRVLGRFLELMGLE